MAGIVIKYGDEWEIHYEREHAIARHAHQIYIAHNPIGPWKCDLGGRWVHGSTVDVCNCGVKYPSSLYFRIRMMNEVRRRFRLEQGLVDFYSKGC